MQELRQLSAPDIRAVKTFPVMAPITFADAPALTRRADLLGRGASATEPTA
jgi:hypothetical protein